MREVTLLEMGLRTLDLLKSPSDFRSWLCNTKGYDGTPGSLHGRRFLGGWRSYGLSLWLNSRLPKFPGRLWVCSHAVIAVFEGFTMPRGYPELIVFTQSPKWVGELIRSLGPKKTATGEAMMPAHRWLLRLVKTFRPRDCVYPGEVIDYLNREFAGEREDADSKPS
jgi:hypothetical protein